jgi:hypothetical protein
VTHNEYRQSGSEENPSYHSRQRLQCQMWGFGLRDRCGTKFSKLLILLASSTGSRPSFFVANARIEVLSQVGPIIFGALLAGGRRRCSAGTSTFTPPAFQTTRPDSLLAISIDSLPPVRRSLMHASKRLKAFWPPISGKMMTCSTLARRF